MRKTFLSALAVALLLAPAARAIAQEENAEMKPLIVASLRGYQELIDDLDHVGKVSDNPDLGKGIEGLIQLVTQGQGIVGLDKSKPWGLAISTDGLQFQIIGFLPINDLEKLLTALGGIVGEPEKDDQGVWKVEAQGQTVYLKQEGEWTFASLGSEFLVNLPKDPIALLGGLHEQYDAALRVYVQNIPEIFRQLAVEQLKIGLEQGFGEGGMQIPGLDNLPGGGNLPGMDALPKLSEEQQKLASTLARQQLDAMAESLNEADQVTVGLKLDRESGLTTGDVSITAVKGSKTAEELSGIALGKTKFGGFKAVEGALNAIVALKLSEGDITQAKDTLASLEEQINEQVGNINLGDDSIKDLLKSFVAEFFDIQEKTVESGQIDLGLALAGKGPHTLLVGSYISDDGAATKLLDRLVETVENEAGFYGIQRDVAEHKGVKFSSVILPIPPGDQGDMLVNILGSDVELVIGIGPKSAYIALGTNGIDELKKVIDASESQADAAASPVEVTAALTPLVKIASKSQDADPNLAMVATALEGSKDKVTLTVKPSENGVNVHFEGEEGLLKVLGTLITSMGPGLPQF